VKTIPWEHETFIEHVFHEGHMLATLESGVKENLVRVARVINAHDALVEACEAARKELIWWDEWNEHTVPSMRKALDMIDSALALVRGEAQDA